MEKYDHRKDLAPRDIRCTRIDNEMKKAGTEHVYLDCRHMNIEKFVEHFQIFMKNVNPLVSILQTK